MQEVHTSVIFAILCTSIVCAVELQSPKTTGRNSKTKVPPSVPKGTKCGISANAPNIGRIIGGEEARPHSWPWQVFIVCPYIPGGAWKEIKMAFCGGSIISEKWVITAAHCLDPIPDVRCNCQVLIGKHDLQRNESTQVVAKIADYFIHEKYDRVKPENGYDLALFKLAKPVKFTDAIQPICLPFGLPELPYEKSCYATGWGHTKFGNVVPSDRLMQLSMTVKYHKDCIIDRVICAVGWEGKKDVCQGDSGGPFACQEQDRKWYLRGVTSMGAEKCELWGVFTKVTTFEKWIKNITSSI